MVSHPGADDSAVDHPGADNLTVRHQEADNLAVDHPGANNLTVRHPEAGAGDGGPGNAEIEGCPGRIFTVFNDISLNFCLMVVVYFLSSGRLPRTIDCLAIPLVLINHIVLRQMRSVIPMFDMESMRTAIHGITVVVSHTLPSDPRKATASRSDLAETIK